jgi:molybdopterin molybdotransferase
MTSADQALQIVLDNVAPLGVERLSITAALGRVLAEEVCSPRDIPGFDNSAMDGYAVRAADVAAASEVRPVRLEVLETVAAGMMPSRQVAPGQAVRTMTGAPIAAGADAVVPVERTRSEGNTVEVMAAAEAGAFVRPRGEDLRRDELVMSAGKTLSPSDLGMLAALNRSTVDVWRRPRVAIVATGDELVDVDQIPSGAQIVNSSAYALAGAIREAGGEPVMPKVARDTPEEVQVRLAEALDFNVVLFHGVAQKPGRPLKFGTIGGRPIFGLPGNPVSTMVCFYLYVRPALLRMSGVGVAEAGLPRVTVRCTTEIRIAANLTEFVRVRLERRDGEVYATLTGYQGSEVLSSLSRADALLIGPAAVSVLKAGDQATVLLLVPGAGGDCTTIFEGRPPRRHMN